MYNTKSEHNPITLKQRSSKHLSTEESTQDLLLDIPKYELWNGDSSNMEVNSPIHTSKIIDERKQENEKSKRSKNEFNSEKSFSSFQKLKSIRAKHSTDNLHDSNTNFSSNLNDFDVKETTEEMKEYYSVLSSLLDLLKDKPFFNDSEPLESGVVVDEHPTVGILEDHESNCNDNERFTECSRCEMTCAGNDSIPCSFECGPPKCECPASQGFVRKKDGQCVPINQCDIELQCPDNEEWTSCGGCEPNCWEEQKICGEYCEEGRCQCKTGMVRNHHGKCVRYAECISQ
ncbi:unnamed protein product [Thelazia callipaeda]|uniref:TIL domain-containing protein n=1 Tax=Thelazia callipaeda TaxID=103827 RepID=A0A0N5D8E5_THECL|nr:unnamed protein product [Thelazia callipaeda]